MGVMKERISSAWDTEPPACALPGFTLLRAQLLLRASDSQFRESVCHAPETRHLLGDEEESWNITPDPAEGTVLSRASPRQSPSRCVGKELIIS